MLLLVRPFNGHVISSSKSGLNEDTTNSLKLFETLKSISEVVFVFFYCSTSKCVNAHLFVLTRAATAN